MKNTIHNTFVRIKNIEQFNKIKEALNQKEIKTLSYTGEDYFHDNNSSLFTDWISPPISFKEISIKEYIRLIKNQ